MKREIREQNRAMLGPEAAALIEPDTIARRIVERWLWDCGEGNQVLGFVQSELLQERIREALSIPAQAPVLTDGLLGCPFCGVAPLERFEKNINGPEYPDHWFVRCENLDCGAGGEAMEETQEAARSAWNTRALGPPHPPAGNAAVEALRLLNKIVELAYDENVCDPLDDAVGYANKAIAALQAPAGNAAVEALIKRAENCAKYDFDTIEMIECKWDLWDEILAALQALEAESGTTDQQLRDALEFGILSCCGPTNDAELKLLDKEVEETWQEYRAALSSTQEQVSDDKGERQS